LVLQPQETGRYYLAIGSVAWGLSRQPGRGRRYRAGLRHGG
jgi:hypothetical protein